MSKTPYYLIDGSGYIFRAYHALPKMNRPDGTPVNAVFGFCSMLMRLEAELNSSNILVVFDAARKTFRNDIYPEYKAHRPPAPDDLIPQFALIREATRAFGVACIEQEGFEADDLIATYTKDALEAGHDVVIVSADKDLLQLIRPRVSLMDPIKNKTMGEPETIEKFGVPPAKVVDVQSLAGDSSDNVPGVPGIGIKTAAQLILEYGDLDSLLARAGEIKQDKRRQSLIDFAEQARISRQLVTLRDDVPLAVPFSAMQPANLDKGVVLQFLEQQNFKNLVKRLREQWQDAGQDLGQNALCHSEPLQGKLREESQHTESSYTLVATEADLKAWITKIHHMGVVAIDTETTGLDPQQAQLVGISLCVTPNEACYIPIAHRHPATQTDLLSDPVTAPPLQQLSLSVVRDSLNPILSNPGILKVGHNIKYDLHILHHAGFVPLQAIDDTMVLSYVLYSSRHGHGMDELANRYLNHTTTTYDQVTGTGKARISFAEVPLEQACTYAAEDADITLRLWQLFRDDLLKTHLVNVYEILERPLIPVLADMERAGVRVDPGVLNTLSHDFNKKLQVIEQDVFNISGHDFNIGSPKQLGEVLFDEMQLGGGKKGKTGAYSTASDVLENLAAQGHEIAEHVLHWRQLSKLKSTYTDALPNSINPKTGRVHTSYMQTVTSTGRLSSTDPNLQNIPIRTEEGRSIRGAFVAEKGNILVSLDYSQIELRLLAHMADIPALKQAFSENRDIHRETAHQVFGIPLDAVDADARRRAKAINFGIIYGISAFGLSQQLGCSGTEAKGYIEAYFARYPGIKAYMDANIAFARQHDYVNTLFGRRCYVTGINDKNPAMRNFAERAAINAPLQGTAADIIKRAMIRMPTALAGNSLNARMILQVHDELVFEVAVDRAQTLISIAQNVMQQAADLSVPLLVESGIGYSWLVAH